MWYHSPKEYILVPQLHCSQNIPFHSSNTFHKNNTIKIRQLIKNNFFPVQYTGRKRRGGFQGCKCMCVLKPQQQKLINSSMPSFVHCEDHTPSHDTGLGALYGCKFISESEYYKFKTLPFWRVVGI